MTRQWDIGDPEPSDVTQVDDRTCEPDDPDSGLWGRTFDGMEWKGYKNGFEAYLSWDELVRRWGPVFEVTGGGTK